LARTSLEDAIDLLFAVSVTDDVALPVDELANLGSRLPAYSAAAAKGEIDLDELLGTGDDEAFLERLAKDVDTRFPTGPSGSTLGSTGRAWTALRRGVTRFKRATVSATTAPAVRAVRGLMAHQMPLLVGDVTAYLARRAPGPIVRAVLSDLEKAAAAAGPLVVVAHSMGGTIVHDILTYFRPDLEVHALITIGSQVGLFEELKLFAASRSDIPGAGGHRVPMPNGVERWINVVDPADPLAFQTEAVFDGPSDYSYPFRRVLGTRRVPLPTALPRAARSPAGNPDVTTVFSRGVDGGPRMHAFVVGVGRYPHCGPAARNNLARGTVRSGPGAPNEPPSSPRTTTFAVTPVRPTTSWNASSRRPSARTWVSLPTPLRRDSPRTPWSAACVSCT